MRTTALLVARWLARVLGIPVLSGLAVAGLLGVTAFAANQSPPLQQPNAATASIPPPPKPLLAEEVFENLDIFKAKEAAHLIPAMNALRGLLGVECSYCHVPHAWADDSKPPKGVARRHFHMIEFINHTFFADANAVSCWTCHRGHARPPDYAPDAQVTDRAARVIAVPADNQQKPAEQVFKNIQALKGEPAGDLPGVMSYLSASLGVACSHCHVEGAFDRDDKPEKVKTRKMFRMAVGVVNEYYGGNGPVGCFTCHQGKTKPEIEPGKPTQATMP